eukprot:10253190-Prorocentrum_lima.AAC.1
MTSSLVGSEMCIRDRDIANKVPDQVLTMSSAIVQIDEVLDSMQSRMSVSYTHLTLPTICSV